MNQNINDTKPPVCVIELDDLDLPVPLDLSLLGNLRVDEHVRHSYIDPESSNLNVDHHVQIDSSRDFGFSIDALKSISTFLLEDDVHEPAYKSRTQADIHALSCELKFDPHAQSSGEGCPDYLDCSDNGLKFVRNFRLEDNVEGKTCINHYHGDENLASNNYVYLDRIEDNVNLGSGSLVNEVQCKVDSHEDLDFSDDVLKYINHILLEEGVEEKRCTLQESEALHAKEKSLYEALWGETLCPASVSCDSSLHGFDDHREGTSVSSQSFSLSPENSSSSGGAAVDGIAGSPVSGFEFLDTFMHLNKDIKQEKFLLGANNDVVCLLDSDIEEYSNESAVVHVETGVNNHEFSNASRGKKHPYKEVLDFDDGRSSKQFAVHRESSLSDDLFDKVLIFRKESEESAIRQEINEATKANMHHDQSLRAAKTAKRGRKKREGKKNEVDLGTQLTLCAQAVASEDLRLVNEFLRQIRQHSTPSGDGMQRLAHYFADGLEARIAGAGTQIYTTLINMPISAADLLKAYHIYLATCPQRRTSNFFSNQTILNVAENARNLHIVDFGTLYGFQWPSFLHKLSLRQGGPPTVRFTAIDFPCPGFRPSQRILETGRRLASYAQKFNIPFEFNGLAQKWETIKLEDIKINKDEVVVVNCLYRLRYVLDETVIADCPRDTVLKLIRKMNPAVFVLGIRNGGHNAPFFLTRFREALFHYSSIFDALDAVIPRERHERMLLERVLFGREAMNTIACEGAERIERPETYKRWQVRIERAGLELLPLNRKIMETARGKVKLYHRDFVINEDGHWLLQGWKGRIAYGLCSWRPSSGTLSLES